MVFGRVMYRVYSTFGRGAGRQWADAHVVIQGEFVAAQHVRPRVTIRLHAPFAALPDALAQATARIYGTIQAHGTATSYNVITYLYLMAV